MNSPFKMKPGRGNMPKTGRGIPPTLMSESPMKQMGETPDLTMKGAGLAKKMQENLNKSDYASSQGLSKDAASGILTGNQYEKKYEVGGAGQRDRILDSAGKVIAEAKETNAVKGMRNENLYKQYEREKKNTESRRANNANTLNVFSGNKKDLTQADIRMQQGLGNMSRR
jgi:hypothetical protein